MEMGENILDKMNSYCEVPVLRKSIFPTRSFSSEWETKSDKRSILRDLEEMLPFSQKTSPLCANSPAGLSQLLVKPFPESHIREKPSVNRGGFALTGISDLQGCGRAFHPG